MKSNSTQITHKKKKEMKFKNVSINIIKIYYFKKKIQSIQKAKKFPLNSTKKLRIIFLPVNFHNKISIKLFHIIFNSLTLK